MLLKPNREPGAIHTATSGEIAAITAKTIVDKDDLLVLEDSESTNAKKSIQVEDLLSQPYGELYSENYNLGAMTLTLQSPTWYKIVQYRQSGLSSRCTLDRTNGEIEIDEPGTYAVDVHFSTVVTVDENYQVSVFKDGFTTARGQRASAPNTAQATDIINLGISAFISCTASSVLDVRVRCLTAAGTTFRTRDCQFRVMRVAP